MASSGKSASPNIKISSVKIPNAATAAKPIVDKKLAKMTMGNYPKAKVSKYPSAMDGSSWNKSA